MTTNNTRYNSQAERLPPQSEQAEEAVLGSCLLDREVILRIAPILAVRDFYHERNGTIYGAMLVLAERDEPVDYMTLLDELQRREQLDSVGGTSYLSGLVGAVPTPIHAEQYARTVADHAFMRRLISAGGKIAGLGFANQVTPERAMATAEQLLAEVDASATPDDLIPLTDVLIEQRERLAARETLDPEQLVSVGLLPTTYRDLDRVLGGGFTRGDLVLLAARPSMGKSSLMLALTSASALAFGLKVAIFSPEMSARALGDRLSAMHSGVSLQLVSKRGRFTDSQLSALSLAQERLAMTDVYIDESNEQDIAMIRSKARRLARTQGLDIVVVDHLQLLPTRNDNRYGEVTAISKALKALARDLGVVVLAVSQLNRDVDKRADKRPQFSDLRESGSLEQDADVILFLYRDEYYDKETERTGLADVEVAKNRNGESGLVTLTWNPETTGFRGMEFYDRVT